MPDNAHIFTLKDNPLFKRVSAYQTVFKSYPNAEVSLKFSDDENWSDTLGERQEMKSKQGNQQYLDFEIYKYKR
jgi:hypothetical protein